MDNGGVLLRPKWELFLQFHLDPLRLIQCLHQLFLYLKWQQRLDHQPHHPLKEGHLLQAVAICVLMGFLVQLNFVELYVKQIVFFLLRSFNMYKLVNDFECVKRLLDNAFIPFDQANTDYQEYLKWLSEGNEPLPADEPLPISEPIPTDEPIPADEPSEG